ncbi:MAG: Ig-like domain-containing protein [Gemmatimonadetes bacterium]|nr:Ig-like domain-containing protein [Gemmatimonadota bacterium]
MHRVSRRLPVALLLVMSAVLSACSETLAPNERVASLSVAAGDQQEAPVATQLPQPVVVRAVDAEGRPVRGARVEWQASGGGTVTPAALETDQDGRVSANWTLGTTAGEQVITATIGLFSATFRATARPGPATAVTVVPGAAELDAIGATTMLQATAQDAHGNAITGRAFVWASDAEAVATVTNAGLVTARMPGTARVRATLDAANGEALITVQPQPASIVLMPPAAQLTALGATVQFQAAAADRNGNPVAVPAAQYVWSSSSPGIVSVNATGLAMAQANGVAQVRAALGNVIGSAQVLVQQTIASLTVSPKVDTLTTARPVTQLSVVARDANNQVIAAPFVSWVSTNAAVAIVTLFGQVQAVTNGTARIRVSSGAIADSATITVRLNTPPKSVADTRTVQKDMTLVVAAPGLLGNDTLGIPAATITSFGGGSLGGAVTTTAAGATVTFGTGGSLKLNVDGSLEFTPSAGFTGAFTFQYRATNAAGVSDAAVTINVGVGPVAVADAYTTSTGVTLDVPAPGLLANDTLGFPAATVASYGGGSLTGDAGSFAAGSLVAFGVGGFLRVNADGSLSITPPTGFTGPITFQYRLSNGIGSSDQTVTITVTPPP